MAHQPTRHRLAPDLDAEAAASVASTLQALVHPGRLRILATLQAGPATVGRLTVGLAMEQSAVSHQLRLLRDLGFVTAERQGRNIEYRLYDNHIGELIEQALSHAEHVRLGVVERDSTAAKGRTQLGVFKAIGLIWSGLQECAAGTRGRHRPASRMGVGPATMDDTRSWFLPLI